MLDLSPETEMLLQQEAAREGVSIETLIRRTFASRPNPHNPKANRLIQTIHQWQTEDGTANEAELTQRDQARKELQTNLDNARHQADMRSLFPEQS